jgi:hypothetical protein
MAHTEITASDMAALLGPHDHIVTLEALPAFGYYIFSLDAHLCFC